MNRRTLKVAFMIFMLAMILLFFYFGFGFSKNSGGQVYMFILNDKAKIAGGLVLLSYPIYRLFKGRMKR